MAFIYTNYINYLSSCSAESSVEATGSVSTSASASGITNLNVPSASITTFGAVSVLATSHSCIISPRNSLQRSLISE